MKLSKVFRSVYDATSKSSSKFGKIGKYAFPFNAQYFIRDAWRKYGKSHFSAAGSDGVNVYANSAGSIYGPTGSIVGRY